MNATRFRKSAIAGLALLFALGVLAPAVEAKGGKSRSGRSSRASGGSSSKGRTSSPSKGRISSPGKRTPGFSGSTPRTRVSGQASYGYHRYPYGHYRPYYYDPYAYFHYGYPSYYYGFLGWPYLAWGWYPPVHTYYEVAAADARDPAMVETDIRPKKAELYLNGEFAGEARDFNGTWDALYIEPGVHTLEFRREGYMTLSLGLRVSAGRHYRISERMQKGEGPDPRSIEAPPAAPQVTAAAAPLPFRGGVEQEPQRRGDEGLRQGLLHIRAAPDDAVIYLDGEFLAAAQELTRLHGAIPVAVGEHTIEVVRPGYASQTQVVRVEEGDPKWLVIDLSRSD